MTDKVSDGTTSVTTPNPMEAGSGAAMAEPFGEPDPISTNPNGHAKVRPGDRIFRGLAEGSGILIVALIAAGPRPPLALRGASGRATSPQAGLELTAEVV